MSWFDTTGIANLAKNALKEAQKQIDKALDIKDEEDTASLHGTSAPDENSDHEMVGNSSAQSDVATSSLAVNLPNTLSASVETTDGSFFDQPIQNSSTVTKPPSSLKCRSLEDPKNANMLSSPTTEIDSSESIEVLTPVTNSGSALTSPSRRSSGGVTMHEDEESESIEVIGSVGMSPIATPESISITDHTQPEQPSNVLPNLREKEEDEVSVEDDSISNTLSEQTITVLETDANLLPITVAPGRSRHQFTISNALPVNVVSVECKTLSRAGEKCNDTESEPPISLSNSNSEANPVTEGHRYTSPEDELHLKQLPKPEHGLDQSYESLDSQTQISDMAHSFEEIRSGSNDMESQPSTVTSTVQNSEQFSDAVLESPDGPGCSQSLFQSLGDDEIETTTSSDIEIISSPNGDSSSTHSGAYRTSPLKISDGKGENFDMLLIKKRRGHTREPSEISMNSGNSDDSGHLPETERLMRRLVEVSETLEQREYRLVELGRQNAELTEQNFQLTAQLESKAKRDGSSDPDGYMQRLSALERKFQQSIREKENLKSKLETLRAEAKEKVAKSEMDKALVERDFMINELQKEGESLSKQVLQHSNIIKKLRAKEKESDALIRRQCDEINELTQETERLKRSLSAKDEVERSQIDAVHKLTSEKRKLERECAILTGNLDDQTQKYESLRKSFECARKELTEKVDLCQELQHSLTKLQNCETEYLSFQRTNKTLLEQMEELREQLRRTERENEHRLIRAKNEHVELLRRLEASETRAEEEKNASALLTVPLMKQLESVQCTLRHKERIWEQRDASFTQQLSEALERVKLITEKEATQRNTIATLQDRIMSLEERLTETLVQAEEALASLQQKTLEAEILEQEYRKCLAANEARQAVSMECLQKQEHSAEVQQATSPSKKDSTEKVIADEAGTLEEASDVKLQVDINPTVQAGFVARHAEDGSPTPSMGNLSLPDSLNSIPWNTADDNLGGTSAERNAPPADSIGDVGYNPSIMFNNTSLLETLQSSLKQRDGEVYQLQWEVSRFQQERNVLSSEISNLTMELDNVRERFERSIRLEEELKDLQNRYDALLQMYGESVEKTEELQLDLVDVKEMYKIQIDDLLKRQRELIASMNQHPSLVSSPGNSR
ncbi:TATA element modulatory factor [Anopheles marshallii]|uniref:TATA element modulatory factor n=1 Tax=Anopheles marshallii TaxID=1521116 RepID=UPI00237B0E6E|nr:TATA element modulatory factor [Anopheles marshallii]